ncbi:MAG: exonuclease domain-containing protein [Planctomycetota bacterium]
MPPSFTGFAVFDLETTGLSIRRHDRIIEIGVVRFDEDFDLVEEWETLINPERDIGASEIHGLTASDLRDAPTFAELLVDIWHRFEGAIPVAHNLAFDRRFLLAEFQRAGVEIEQFDGLCTCKLVEELDLSTPSARLEDVCRSLGLPIGDAHSAGHDAKMAAEILKRIENPASLVEDLVPPSCPSLWKRGATPLGVTRQKARETPMRSALHTLARRVERESVSDGASRGQLDEYLLILDRVLDDRIIEEAEIEELSFFADECGIQPSELDTLHERYVSALAAAALGDGVVTDAERRDLYRVSDLLGVSRSKAESLLEVDQLPSEFETEDLSGLTVCFTGTSRCRIDGELLKRDQLEALAESFGLVPKRGVSKKLDLAVLADPDSMSGKAKKAREYGVRIMAERVFWRKLGIDVG